MMSFVFLVNLIYGGSDFESARAITNLQNGGFAIVGSAKSNNVDVNSNYGQNDFWVIKGANKTFYPNASINIFNRFGKLVAQIPIDSQGWNGLYQGKLLSSDDYWFNANIYYKGELLNLQGHFALKR